MASAPRSFHALFDAQALASPDALAVAAARGGSSKDKVEVESPELPAWCTSASTYTQVTSRSRILAAGLAATCPEGVVSPAVGSPLLAVQVPRTHPDFVPLLVAASRRGLPFVLLSTDLPDLAKEAQRNSWILENLQPSLLVKVDVDALADKAQSSVLTVTVAQLLAAAALDPSRGAGIAKDPHIEADCTWCLLFTGGSQRLKVARCTHAMVLHEQTAYPRMAPLRGGPPRVLGNVSCFWPAAALGQLSIALAYGGCLVITEASEPLELRRAVESAQIDVLGLVPDQLGLLAQEPSRELPWVRLVFSWGERLPPNVARRWASHPRAQLQELLIATEYWLALCAEPLGPEPTTARPVAGAEVVALCVVGSDAGEAASEPAAPSASRTIMRPGEVGELCIAGPMVTPGYLDIGPGSGSSASPSPLLSPFAAVGDRRFFTTGDLVRVVPGGFVFLGRGDMLTKEKGQWVDMAEVEARLQALESVSEARIVPDPYNPSSFHAFVALDLADRPAHVALRQVRTSLTQRVSMHLVQKLPRNCATRKVDLAELRSAIQLGGLESWPILPAPVSTLASVKASGQGPPVELVSRLMEKGLSQLRWTVGLLLFALIGFARPGALFEQRRRPGGSGRAVVVAVAALLWRVFAGAPLGLLTFSYMHLASVYGDDWDSRSTCLIHEVPFGRFGAIALLHVCRHFSRAAHWALLAWSATGLGLACSTGKPLSWTIAFWAGVGHQAALEGHRWIDPGYWQRHLRWNCLRLKDFYRMALAAITARLQGRSRNGYGAAISEIGAKVAAEVPTKDDDTSVSPTSTGAGDGDRVVGKGAWNADAQSYACAQEASTKEELEKWRGRYDRYWWHNVVQTVVAYSAEEMGQIRAALALPPTAGAPCGGLGCGGVSASAAAPPEAQKLFCLIEQVDPSLQPVTMDMSLSGMDSLRLSLLASLIQANLGVGLTGLQLHGAATPRELLGIVELEESAAVQERKRRGGSEGESNLGSDSGAEASNKYAFWWSPGQHTPMGAWVLRSDEAIDTDVLLAATQWVVDRHSALRAVRMEPLRLTSFLYDSAVLCSLYLPLAHRLVSRIVGWGFANSWPRVEVRSRVQVYPTGWGNTPLEVVDMHGGQDMLESAFARRRRDFGRKPPFDIALYRLHVQLLGEWEMWGGSKVVILAEPPCSDITASSPSARFRYRDVPRNLEGVLLSPHDVDWPPPPWGFPALFAARLSDGSIAWLRFESFDRLRVIWKANEQDTRYSRMWGKRRAFGTRAIAEVAGEVVVSFLFVQIFHCFADGACYYPVVGDLTDAYNHAVAEMQKGVRGPGGAFSLPRRPPPPEAFAVLQGRLLETLRGRPAADRHSLRGSVWGYSGQGYSHMMCLQGEAIEALNLCAMRYSIPLDYLLLVLVILGIARASGEERVELTLYVPMRDGHEVSMVGLFADWRDIVVAVPREHATVLGVAVEVADVLRQRRWSVYNALRKSERTVCNFMHLDPQANRGIFKQVEDGQWSGGDVLGLDARRGKELGWTNQPLRFDFVQEHAKSWWLSVNVEYARYPPAWMRRFICAVEEAVVDLALRPTALAHRQFPEEFY